MPNSTSSRIRDCDAMQNVEDHLTAVLAKGRNVHAYAMQCSNGGLRIIGFSMCIVSLGGGLRIAYTLTPYV